MNFSLAASAQLIGSLSSVLLHIFLARNLGLIAFGEFAFNWAIAMFLATFNSAGIQQAVLSQQYADKEKFFHSARLLNLASIGVISLVFFNVSLILNFEHQKSVLIIFVAFAIRDFVKRELASDHKYLKILIIEIVNCIALAILVIFFLYEAIIITPEAIISIAYAFSLLLFTKKLLPKRQFVSRIELIQIYRFSVFIFPATILGITGLPVFPIFLGLFLGLEAVGIFRLIQNIFGISNILNQIYDSWMQPRIRRNPDSAFINTIQLTNIVFIIFIGFIFYLFYENIFSTVYGDIILENPLFQAPLVIASYSVFGLSVILTVERIRSKVLSSPRIFLNAAIVNFIGCLMTYTLLVLSGKATTALICLSLSMLFSSLYSYHKVEQEIKHDSNGI